MTALPAPIPIKHVISLTKSLTGNYNIIVKETNGFSDKVFVGTLLDAKEKYNARVYAIRSSGLWQLSGSHSSKEHEYAIFEWAASLSDIIKLGESNE